MKGKVQVLSFVAAGLVLAGAPAQAGNREDARLGKRVEQALQQDERLRDYMIEANADDGVVTLTGKVALDAAKVHAEKVASIPGVRRVENQIEIAPLTVEERQMLQEQMTRQRAQLSGAGDAKPQLGQAKEGPAHPAGAGKMPGQADPQQPAPETVSPQAQPAAGEHEAAPGQTDAQGFVHVELPPTPAGDPQKMVSGENVTESWVTTRIMTELESDEALKRSNVEVVTSPDFIVTLKGTVTTDAARQRAMQIAKNVKGVRAVEDQMKVTTRRPLSLAP
jgi:osmotically-inducible protein OsmY